MAGLCLLPSPEDKNKEVMLWGALGVSADYRVATNARRPPRRGGQVYADSRAGAALPGPSIFSVMPAGSFGGLVLRAFLHHPVPGVRAVHVYVRLLHARDWNRGGEQHVRNGSDQRGHKAKLRLEAVPGVELPLEEQQPPRVRTAVPAERRGVGVPAAPELVEALG